MNRVEDQNIRRSFRMRLKEYVSSLLVEINLSRTALEPDAKISVNEISVKLDYGNEEESRPGKKKR